jgi:hypothetical protein
MGTLNDSDAELERPVQFGHRGAFGGPLPGSLVFPFGQMKLTTLDNRAIMYSLRMKEVYHLGPHTWRGYGQASAGFPAAQSLGGRWCSIR